MIAHGRIRAKWTLLGKRQVQRVACQLSNTTQTSVKLLQLSTKINAAGLNAEARQQRKHLYLEEEEQKIQ
eukprot:m.377289 g.377289  ORF g.377289 m.377289 type:complete len:70 (-) comp86288_c0_seq1:94-303(-)